MTSPEQQALPMTVPFARLLLANGDPGGAARLLNQHLSSLDPDNAPCDLILLEAAALYSDITGDPGWTRYTVRARLLFPPPRPTVPSPRRAEPGTAGHMAGPADGPTGLHRPHGDPGSGPDSPLVLLHEAQTAHWQGRCGEAIHTATRAVDLWRSQRHRGGGTTLLLWLAAMLCACRRDLEVEALLLADGRLLPIAGSPERYEFAVYGIRTFTKVATGHDSVCARRPPLAALAELSAHTAAEAATQPWPERRGLWWQLLLTLPGSS
jgi:hypothetical protein